MIRVSGISQELLETMFIAGLKPLIRQELQMNMPVTLLDAFAIAKAQETKLENLQSVARTSSRWQAQRNSTFSVINTGGTAMAINSKGKKSRFNSGCY